MAVPPPIWFDPDLSTPCPSPEPVRFINCQHCGKRLDVSGPRALFTCTRCEASAHYVCQLKHFIKTGRPTCSKCNDFSEADKKAWNKVVQQEGWHLIQNVQEFPTFHEN
jgi:transcription elongation factor Elf1